MKFPLVLPISAWCASVVPFPPRPIRRESRGGQTLINIIKIATVSTYVRGGYGAVWGDRRRLGSDPCDVLIANQSVFTSKELEKYSTNDIKFTIGVYLVGAFQRNSVASTGSLFFTLTNGKMLLRWRHFHH